MDAQDFRLTLEWPVLGGMSSRRPGGTAGGPVTGARESVIGPVVQAILRRRDLRSRVGVSTFKGWSPQLENCSAWAVWRHMS